MTGLNVQNKDLKGQSFIEEEHVDNNLAVREMLVKRGTLPENLPPAEDVKKLQRKLSAEEKKLVPSSKKVRKNDARFLDIDFVQMAGCLPLLLNCNPNRLSQRQIPLVLRIKHHIIIDLRNGVQSF